MYKKQRHVFLECMNIAHASTEADFSFTFIFTSIALHEEKDVEKAICLLLHELKSHPNDAVIVNHVFAAMVGLIKDSGQKTCDLANN